MSKVTMYCHGIISESYKNKSLWEDIWLTWNIKPGRKNKKCIGPTLISKKDLEYDIEDCKIQIPKYIKMNENSSLINFVKNELNKNLYILNELEKNNIYIEETNEKDLHNLYTAKEYIDKKEAERLCKKLLEDHYGLKNIIFKWKRPKITIQTV